MLQHTPNLTWWSIFFPKGHCCQCGEERHGVKWHTPLRKVEAWADRVRKVSADDAQKEKVCLFKKILKQKTTGSTEFEWTFGMGDQQCYEIDCTLFCC